MSKPITDPQKYKLPNASSLRLKTFFRDSAAAAASIWPTFEVCIRDWIRNLRLDAILLLLHAKQSGIKTDLVDKI